MYRAQCVIVNNLIKRTKMEYFSNKIIAAPNQQALFSVTHRLLGLVQVVHFPNDRSHDDLANDFAIFFSNKILNLRLTMQNMQRADSNSIDDVSDLTADTCLSNFGRVCPVTVVNAIRSMKKSSCELDPIPTDLVYENLDKLLVVIVSIINQSILNNTVPDNMKLAIVKPILKKPNLSLEIGNYRPVSNLPFISKVLEKVISIQLVRYLTVNGLHEPLQSGFTTGCSTETALLRVTSDLLNALDGHSMGILVLLDLSSAFDTLDHGIMLQRFEGYYHILGDALEWLRSYISDRLQYVKVGISTSECFPLKFGVPQI